MQRFSAAPFFLLFISSAVDGHENFVLSSLVAHNSLKLKINRVKIDDDFTTQNDSHSQILQFSMICHLERVYLIFVF